VLTPTEEVKTLDTDTVFPRIVLTLKLLGCVVGVMYHFPAEPEIFIKPKAVRKDCIVVPSSKISPPLVEIKSVELEQAPVLSLIVNVLPAICEVGGRTRVPDLFVVFVRTRSVNVLIVVISLLEGDGLNIQRRCTRYHIPVVIENS